MSHFEKLEKHSSSYGRVFVFEVERRGGGGGGYYSRMAINFAKLPARTPSQD